MHKCYRSVALLNRMINNWMTEWLMPLQLTITRSVHVCNFLLVRHYRHLQLRHVIMFSTVSVLFMVGWVSYNSFKFELIKFSQLFAQLRIFMTGGCFLSNVGRSIISPRRNLWRHGNVIRHLLEDLGKYGDYEGSK